MKPDAVGSYGDAEKAMTLTCVATTTSNQIGMCQVWTLVLQTLVELGLWMPEDKSVVGASDGSMTLIDDTTAVYSATS